MNWLRKLFRIPELPRADDPSVAVTKARAVMERYRAAIAKRDDADLRKDDRDLGRALMELSQIQRERLEMGL